MAYRNSANRGPRTFSGTVVPKVHLLQSSGHDLELLAFGNFFIEAPLSRRPRQRTLSTHSVATTLD